MTTEPHFVGVTTQTLRDWREARGWSQEQLAVRAGVTAATVRKIELGRAGRLTWRVTSGLADALGVHQWQIKDLGYEHDEQGEPIRRASLAGRGGRGTNHNGSPPSSGDVPPV